MATTIKPEVVVLKEIFVINVSFYLWLSHQFKQMIAIWIFIATSIFPQFYNLRQRPLTKLSDAAQQRCTRGLYNHSQVTRPERDK